MRKTMAQGNSMAVVKLSRVEYTEYSIVIASSSSWLEFPRY